MSDHLSYRLPNDFVMEYVDKEPPFGFKCGGGNTLGEITFIGKHSNLKADGSKERWWEVCQRVVEGMYSALKDHCLRMRTPWTDEHAHEDATQAFDRMFHFKWMPAGRGVQYMGTEFVAKHGSAVLQSCAFLSTQAMAENPWRAFCRLMEMSMLGIGVGMDTRGENSIKVRKDKPRSHVEFVVPDSREGWVQSLRLLVESYFVTGAPDPDYDYSLVRPAGSPLKTLGGFAGGPEVLWQMHERLRGRLEAYRGKYVDSRLIADMANLIGFCVVSGNNRRTAEIIFGRADDKDFLNLKNWTLEENAERMHPVTGWGGLSNNTVFRADDMRHVADTIPVNGEPGIYDLELAQQFGRLIDPPNGKDWRVLGANPCCEQSLEDNELCNLVEVFPTHHEGIEDFKRTLKYAYLYGKTVTLIPTHWPECNEIMVRNRRIGLSLTGLFEFTELYGWQELRSWLDAGYAEVCRRDVQYSDWLGIRESIKMTSVKPSGCRPWDALTTTDQGLLTLAEIMAGHPEDEEWAPVNGLLAVRPDGKKRISASYDNGKAITKIIHLSYGVDLESTPNHQWFVTHNYDHSRGTRRIPVDKWVRADELQAGDVIAVETNLYDKPSPSYLRKINMRSIKMRSDVAQISQPGMMTADLAWLCGYLWGDGAQSPRQWRIRFSDENTFNIEKAARIIEDTFDIVPTVENAGRTDMQLTVASAQLWHWFVGQGFWKYFHDEGHDLNLIPEAVRRSSKEHVIAFVAGLLDADGGCYVHGQDNKLSTVITNSQSMFSSHLQHIMWSVGLVAGRSRMTGSEGHKGSGYYSMTFSGALCDPGSMELLRRHSEKIDRVMCAHPTATYRTQRTQEPGRVFSVEDGEVCGTYDIEVPKGHHYFAGAFKSHNTVSLEGGVTPGVHAPVVGGCYLRRARYGIHNPIISVLEAAGYPVEPAVNDPERTKVVTFPVRGPEVRSETEVSVWEKAHLAALLQAHWADNMVSATFSFMPDEADQIRPLIDAFEGKLKCMSFLPKQPLGQGYDQMPYEQVSTEEFERIEAGIRPIDRDALYLVQTQAQGDRFCDSDSCEVPA